MEQPLELANQHGTSETDLAWLAGSIEADGWISLQTYATKDSYLGRAVKPTIGFCGQDALALQAADKIWRSLGVNGFLFESRINPGLSNRPMIYLETSKQINVKRVIDAILPYLRGEKRARAELVLRYVNQRLAAKKKVIGDEDIAVIKSFIDAHQDGKGPKSLRSNLTRLVRDYEQNAA